MERFVTPNGFLVIQHAHGLDVYRDDSTFECELSNKSFADFSFDEKVDGEKLDLAIDDELDTLKTMEKLNEC